MTDWLTVQTFGFNAGYRSALSLSVVSCDVAQSSSRVFDRPHSQVYEATADVRVVIKRTGHNQGPSRNHIASAISYPSAISPNSTHRTNSLFLFALPSSDTLECFVPEGHCGFSHNFTLLE